MKAKKTSINNLVNVSRCPWRGPETLNLHERGLYTEKTADGAQYDFVFAPKPESGRLIVFFSGDARRSKFQPPVFQRWSWASKYPANCLYFSDPALYRDATLGLAWYAGSSGGDYLEHIWGIVESVLPKLGVKADEVFAYGSSGGGFAALRSALYFDGLRVVAINPQTNLWAYPHKWTSRLTRAAYGAETLNDVDPREHYKFTSLDRRTLDGSRRIFLAQNVRDEEHYRNHFTPLLDFACENSFQERITTKLFSDESGHAGAEDEETFAEALRFIRQ